MKKILSLLMILVLLVQAPLLALAEAESVLETVEEVTMPAPAEEPTAEPTEEATAKPTETVTVEPTKTATVEPTEEAPTQGATLELSLGDKVQGTLTEQATSLYYAFETGDFSYVEI